MNFFPYKLFNLILTQMRQTESARANKHMSKNKYYRLEFTVIWGASSIEHFSSFEVYKFCFVQRNWR